MRCLIDRVMTVRVILPLLIIYCHYVCSATSTCNSIHKNTSIVIDGPCPAGTVISPNHLPVEFDVTILVAQLTHGFPSGRLVCQKTDSYKEVV